MRKWIILSGAGLLCPVIAAAQIHPVVNIAAGVDTASVSTQSTIGMIAPFTNTYLGTNANNTQVLAGLFLGGETELPSQWRWQYGVRFFQTDAFDVQGDVYQFSDPLFYNLTYQYEIRNRRVMAETKLFATFKSSWHPYGVAAVGEAFNFAGNYQEIPLSSTSVPMQQPFQDHTTSDLAYSFGLGLDYSCTQHMRIGASYRWSELGKASLGTSPIQDSTSTIQHSRLQASEFLVELSYVV